jgi:phage baseplate assembly protein W
MGIRTAEQFDKYKTSAKSTDVYSDFNHTFLPHPNTGQISRKVDIDAITLAVRNLLLTNKYERLRNPEYGGNIRRFLFEVLEPRIEREIEEHIEETIRRFEPRINLEEVKVQAVEEDNALYVKILFYIITEKELQDIDLVFYRVR